MDKNTKNKRNKMRQNEQKRAKKKPGDQYICIANKNETHRTKKAKLSKNKKSVRSKNSQIQGLHLNCWAVFFFLPLSCHFAPFRSTWFSGVKFDCSSKYGFPDWFVSAPSFPGLWPWICTRFCAQSHWARDSVSGAQAQVKVAGTTGRAPDCEQRV